MPKIKDIKAREIIDSRAVPTVEVDVFFEDGAIGRASSPSGASTGSFEAHELRDGGSEYSGKGVTKAIDFLEGVIKESLVGKEFEQKDIDNFLCELDGTENKKNLGANSILAVSLAFAKACSVNQSVPLFRYISSISKREPQMPHGLFNVINGGVHADSGIAFQEFMIAPSHPRGWREEVRMAVEIYQTLKSELSDQGYSTSVGDEGGFAPKLSGNREALTFLVRSIEKSGYKPGQDVKIALDVAGNELIDSEGLYQVDDQKYSTALLVDYYKDIVKNFPIFSIEDPFSEDDEEGFIQLTSEIGSEINIVGDDLFVTNRSRLKDGIQNKSANSIIIKPNQVGTLTETLETLDLAVENNIVPIVSHRSGETEDVFISHLSAGFGTSFIKSGAPARGERTSKYNELLRIQELL